MKSTNKIVSFFNALFVEFHQLSIIEKIEKSVKSLRPAEKIAFYVFTIIMVVTSLYLLFRVNQYFLVEVPTTGGSFVEGVLGSPRFINPILAISDTDKDLTALVYAGLLKLTPEGYTTDLAKSYSISEDGLTYNVILRDDIFFHDGRKVTTDDIVFTIEKALDTVIKSPRKNNWEGVQVEKVSDQEISFILKKPYAPFIETLTIGILPRHIWQDATSEEFPFSEWNVSPVGAGPYKLESTKRNSAGILTSISLEAYDKCALGRPKIDKITFKFYQNEADLSRAYASKEVESAYGLKTQTENNKNTKLSDNTSLPRIFGVFFNQNISPVFLDKEVRRALDLATPKELIVQNVLHGYAKIINGPSPQDIETYDSTRKLNTNDRLVEARSLLEKSGWKANTDGILEKKTKTETVTLKFSISTSDTPELKQVADLIKTEWEKVGARVEVRIFEAGDLSQNVIRPRKYDALLFGEVINQSGDLYPFWHSSQRNDPGLNIAMYANIATDKLLEEIRAESDPEKRELKRHEIVREIQKDFAAIFLFAPQMIYVPAPQIKNIKLAKVSAPSDRFGNIHSWYIETDNVWKFFAN